MSDTQVHNASDAGEATQMPATRKLLSTPRRISGASQDEIESIYSSLPPSAQNQLKAEILGPASFEGAGGLTAVEPPKRRPGWPSTGSNPKEKEHHNHPPVQTSLDSLAASVKDLQGRQAAAELKLEKMADSKAVKVLHVNIAAAQSTSSPDFGYSLAP
ncbi:hypothetical protein CVT26_002415 [Gymnopilus dilepis]|uniref:Uncharacterized protein n=1 Tax=Gymnopilus dilepis TaxID=231916 RepID=A0A409Y3G5_9AGAR|nr:hypothetical protein CVT26_002415 [Gymnopilus dilepis]